MFPVGLARRQHNQRYLGGTGKYVDCAMRTGIIANMNQDLNDITKKIADTLIDMSAQFADKMDKWASISGGEGSLQNTERAGFVNKNSADTGIDLVIDIHALNDGTEATLRTWALEGKVGDDGVKVFNNIQLTFEADYEKARRLTERFDTVTRDDIRALLHEPDTNLQSVVVCNQTELTQTVQIQQGKYYDVSADEIIEQGLTDEVSDTLGVVLALLKRTK